MLPETHQPGDMGIVTIWRDGQPVQRELPWGLRPVEPRGKPVSLLRWESRAIIDPCLVVLHDFALKIDGEDRYRVRLETGGPFCVAGVWRRASADWPAAYAMLTTEAYPDVAPFKDRHMAVVREEDWFDWLQLTRQPSEILRPFPAGTFDVAGPKIAAPSAQPRRTPARPVTRDLFDLS